MTVGELQDALSDYGRHLSVDIVVEAGPLSTRYPVFEVDTSTQSGETVVELTATS